MTIKSIKNRILLLSCIAIFFPGSFAFGFPGIMGQYWQTVLNINSSEIGKCIFIMLSGVGFSMYLTGRFQEKYGPSILIFTGSILCGGSVILLGVTLSLTIIYLWAFLIGVGTSFIYIPVLTVVQRWFPVNKGLVSGLVNMTFGLSAAIMAPFFTHMLNRSGYQSTIYLSGIMALVTGIIISGFIKMPDGDQAEKLNSKNNNSNEPFSFDVKESIKTKTFWLIWITWAMAGAAGISMVFLSIKFGVSKGLTLGDAVLILTAFNLTNGLGRFISGIMSDFINRNMIMTISFFSAGVAYLLLPHLNGLMMWGVLAAVVGIAFGALFTVSAPLVSDCFGLKHFGAIIGLIFTSYGFLSGLIGPWLSGYILDLTGNNFTIVFSYLGIFFLISSITIWFARPPQKKKILATD